MTYNDSSKISFSASDEVRSLGVRGAYFVIDFDPGKAQPQAAATLLRAAVETIRRERPDIKSDATLAGFRDLHTKVGVSNRKHIASPENMVALILGGRDVPSINPIVDIYNTVSLETMLALGAHDTAKIHGPIALKLTNGTEDFTPLGANEKKVIGSGEYAYVDEGQNEVICRLETRQCEKTKVTSDTNHCFFIVEGNENTEWMRIENAVSRLQSLLALYCGGKKTEEIVLVGKASG